jgi:hypothetical protein
MSDSHTYIIAATLILVAFVGVAGLYFSTSGTTQQGIVQAPSSRWFGGGLMITGADTAQLGSADFNVTPTINIQFKNFTDSSTVAANITPNQTTICMFSTAVGNTSANMTFSNGTTAGGTSLVYPFRNLTPTTDGCEVVYSTLSEVNASQGAFGVENLGNVDIRVNASDATGCVFGESAPASCVRQIVANQQFEGACNTTNSTNFCIRTVINPGGPEAIHYVDFNSADSPVILCEDLDQNAGLEIDLNYTFSIPGVPPGLYVDSITFVADNVTDSTCET